MKKYLILFVFLFLFCGQVFGQVIIGKHTGIHVSAGKETNWTGTLKFGQNADVDSADTEDVWLTGGTFTPFPDDSTIEIVSASASDASAGTGARTVTIYGVDSSFTRISETVTLNGQTEVDLTNSYRVIHRAIVATAGSGLTNAGALTIQTKTNDVAMVTMGVGEGQSETTIFAIAADETAFITCWGISNITPGSDIKAKLYVFNVAGNVWNLKDTMHSRVTGESAPHRKRSDFPLKIDGAAIIKVTVTPDIDDTDVTGHYLILYR